MALKTIDQSPTIADTIVFEIDTPGADGCFMSNPHMVNKVIIYFVERNFAEGGDIRYDKIKLNPTSQTAAAKAQDDACTNPTIDNIQIAANLKAAALSSASTTTSYYNESRAVALFGNDISPAWLSTNTTNALIQNIPTDSNGNAQYGRFQLEWQPMGMREGDYFICWTWTPNIAGDSLSNFQQFALQGATQLTTSIPTHFTKPNKYTTLLDRYLPDMFRLTLGDGDITPDTLTKYNAAVAQQFTDLENLSNQIIDLTDANATHEAFLPILANMYGVKLKSDDPTLWRRQIKESVPIYKKKGTKAALNDALSAAGMQLTKVTNLWQMVSSFTWQESFLTLAGQTQFQLSQTALPEDINNFGLWYRPAGTADYVVQSASNASFSVINNKTIMTWLGPVLAAGDIVRILYLYNVIPDATNQTIENYVRTLPLADQRDETDQLYPPKNWNVRLIEEDDPLFSVIIANRHPFSSPLIFGKVRTEFPFSENAYNMDEYNGSIRDSFNPCDIAKDFMDHCRYCQSSTFNLDIEVTNLSDHRIAETLDIIKENVPFHAVIHSINFAGSVDELIQPPVETIEALVMIKGSEMLIAGSAQIQFDRFNLNKTTPQQILRNMLANIKLVYTGTGTISNSDISLYCGTVPFDTLGIDVPNAQLDILSPSPSAGTYNIANPSNNVLQVLGVSEPISQSGFAFNLSNRVYHTSLATISNADIKTFVDDTVNYGLLGVKSQFDVDHGIASNPWTVTILAYSSTPYVINNIQSNGSLLLNDPNNTLPTAGAVNLSYTLKDPSNTITTSANGRLSIHRRGTIKVVEPVDVRMLMDIGDWAYYSGTQYRISGFVHNTTDTFYIDAYTGLGAAGATVVVFKRLVDGVVGNFYYQGTQLQTAQNLEANLPIMNGTNANTLFTPNQITESNQFMENYLVEINQELYPLSSVNGHSLILGGPQHDWTTSGKPVAFNVYQYTKQPIVAQGTALDFIDRRGKEIITEQTQLAMPMSFRAMMVNAARSNEPVDILEQTENISFSIEYADGTSQQGEL